MLLLIVNIYYCGRLRSLYKCCHYLNVARSDFTNGAKKMMLMFICGKYMYTWIKQDNIKPSLLH